MLLKKLDRVKLEDLPKSLFECFSLPPICTTKWKSFKSALEGLAINLGNYIEHRKSKSDQMAELHHSPTPVRSPGDGIAQLVFRI